MTFMLQKEVMRMVAEPGTEEYGRLSVMLQYRFNMGRLFDVPPGAFRPAPKVMSSIVRMVPRPVAECTARRGPARQDRHRRLRPAPQDPAQHPARICSTKPALPRSASTPGCAASGWRGDFRAHRQSHCGGRRPEGAGCANA
jgi:hypothetical protein